jgi:hypothetical protein
VDDLLDRLYAAGFAVELTDAGPQLLPLKAHTRLPADLLAEVKQNRAAIVAHLRAQQPRPLSDAEFCQRCARPVDAGDREALAGSYLLCAIARAKAARDADGNHHAASEPCPYRESP